MCSSVILAREDGNILSNFVSDSILLPGMRICILLAVVGITATVCILSHVLVPIWFGDLRLFQN